jgi:predicted lactoylglutathione lyase
MLLTHEKFAQFSPRPLASPATAEVLIALSVESKDEVERLARAAIEAGGKEALPPQDYGFMQQRSFLDLDGHHWEVLYMDPSEVPPQS